MALYFVARKNVDLNALGTATKVVWNGGASAEFDAWRASIDSQVVPLPMSFGEVPAALITGVIDIYVTNSLEAATTAAANTPGASLFDQNGTLLSVTPSDEWGDDGGPVGGDGGPGGGGGAPQDVPFWLLIHKDQDIDDLSGITIAVVAGSDAEGALAALFGAKGIEFQTLVFQDSFEAVLAYSAGRVDAVAAASAVEAAIFHRLLGTLSPDWSSHVTHKVDWDAPDAPSAPDHVITIALLYEAGLGREADSAGLNYWVDQYEAGMGLDAMAGLFLDSAEFTSRFGDDDAMSNAEFVNVMYLNVLDRPGEQGGFVYWVGAMDGGLAREAVLIGFAASEENMLASNVGSLREIDAGYWGFT